MTRPMPPTSNPMAEINTRSLRGKVQYVLAFKDQRGQNARESIRLCYEEVIWNFYYHLFVDNGDGKGPLLPFRLIGDLPSLKDVTTARSSLLRLESIKREPTYSAPQHAPTFPYKDDNS